MGDAFHKAPANIQFTNPRKVTATKKEFSNAILRLMDKHSMSGRAIWIWLHHRSKEARHPVNIVDDNSNVMFKAPLRYTQRCIIEHGVGTVLSSVLVTTHSYRQFSTTYVQQRE